MRIQTASWERGTERKMGHVYANVVIRNALDEGKVAEGELAPERVRTVVLNDVLVDTGATMLSLPAPLIAQLGLKRFRETTVRTAGGLLDVRIFRGASLSVEGRVGDFECLELPPDALPLLGVIPLEAMGLEPDIVNHVLRPRPEGPKESHILLMSGLR